MIKSIWRVMARQFQFSTAQVFFSVCVLAAVSAGTVTIAQWRFSLLDRVQAKIETSLSDLFPVKQPTAPPNLPDPVDQLPALPDLHDTVLNTLAVQSRLPNDSDLVVVKGEDLDYLQSILDKIFPDGTSRLSKEEISIEILRYIASVLKAKANSGNYATKFLRDGYALCGGKSISFQTLARMTGIPARMVNMYGLVNQGGHTMVEVYYDDQWHLYDPSFGLVFYSEPEYSGTGRIASLEELITGSVEKWYSLKVVDRPWVGYYDTSVRSFGVVQAEEDYMADHYRYPFLAQYRQMFATAFPVAYDRNQIISFPVAADLTRGKFSVGEVDGSHNDTVAATAALETAGKAGTYYLIGTSNTQYVHTWFIKVPAPRLVRITYYSTEDMPPVLMLFPLKAAHVISSSQKDKKAEFLLRVSDPDASVQIWSSKGIFWVDAMQVELVNTDSSSALDK
ncbi:MAG TPA: transglutaminase-like domain-containing protein [Anaerolineales bacterium]|nr:transglutaminase-like domain-containing protein [Anaerolineales bacterium]